MSNVEFKAGDKVYFPRGGSGIYNVSFHKGTSYPVIVKFRGDADSFTENGKGVISDGLSSIFHATEENCELLSKLYGVQFEKPKKVLKGSDLTRKLLADGKWVICKVSDVNDEVVLEKKHVVIVTNFDTEDDVFETTCYRCLYAVPYAVIDPINTSKPMGIEV